MSGIKSIIAVPARLDSTRLPNKLTKIIKGKTIIERVLNQCKLAKGPEDIFLCTDSSELRDLVHKLGFKVLMTPKSCKSGSERISQVADNLIELAWSQENNGLSSYDLINEKEKETLIINVQGDQPFVNPKFIENIHNFFLKNQEIQMVTPIYKLAQDKIHSPNVVKVIKNFENKAIYFSRSAIPYIRDIKYDSWANYHQYWGHIGIYGYRGDLIRNWNNFKTSSFEDLEKLEQLKLIANGIPIECIEVSAPYLSIDSNEDLLEAKKIDSTKLF